MEQNNENIVVATEEVVKCKECLIPLKEDRHGNAIFCSKKCNDKFHNWKKKEEKQRLERLAFKIEEQGLMNELEEAQRRSEEVKQIAISNQLILESLDVPKEGLDINSTYLKESGFRDDIYDRRIQSKRYPGFYYTEHMDYGVMWRNVNTISIVHKEHYITL